MSFMLRVLSYVSESQDTAIRRPHEVSDQGDRIVEVRDGQYVQFVEASDAYHHGELLEAPYKHFQTPWHKVACYPIAVEQGPSYDFLPQRLLPQEPGPDRSKAIEGGLASYSLRTVHYLLVSDEPFQVVTHTMLDGDRIKRPTNRFSAVCAERFGTAAAIYYREVTPLFGSNSSHLWGGQVNGLSIHGKHLWNLQYHFYQQRLVDLLVDCPVESTGRVRELAGGPLPSEVFGVLEAHNPTLIGTDSRRYALSVIVRRCMAEGSWTALKDHHLRSQLGDDHQAMVSAFYRYHNNQRCWQKAKSRRRAWKFWSAVTLGVYGAFVAIPDVPDEPAVSADLKPFLPQEPDYSYRKQPVRRDEKMNEMLHEGLDQLEAEGLAIIIRDGHGSCEMVIPTRKLIEEVMSSASVEPA